jgi:DNA repair and recombination RAD54-like protein
MTSVLLQLSDRSLALRKTKRLGSSKQFHIVRPGDYANALVKHTGSTPDEDGGDDDGAEELPTSASNLPPFEPLVLWSQQDDPENKVEVIPQLACKLRPHQREGVQFLFECTMGLRGFEGEVSF